MKWIGAGRMLKRSADAEEALRELCETRFLTWVVDQVRGARGQGPGWWVQLFARPAGWQLQLRHVLESDLSDDLVAGEGRELIEDGLPQGVSLARLEVQEAVLACELDGFPLDVLFRGGTPPRWSAGWRDCHRACPSSTESGPAVRGQTPTTPCSTISSPCAAPTRRPPARWSRDPGWTRRSCPWSTATPAARSTMIASGSSAKASCGGASPRPWTSS
ncbi:MAG TPA: hypothetical protein QGF58_18260 [Myxococcota bacterium]|nr:hypothetical protein [Myxococcota bacterium]